MFVKPMHGNRQKSYIYTLVQKNADGRIKHASRNTSIYAPDSENGKESILNSIKMMKRLEAENHKMRPEDKCQYAVAVQEFGSTEKQWFNGRGQLTGEADAFS